MSGNADPWDDLEPSISPSTPTPSLRPSIDAHLATLAQTYSDLREQQEALSEELGRLEREIAHYFPEEAGEIAKTAGSYEIIVSRAERWSWDKDALESVFSQGEVPDYVKRSLSIDKRKFLRLPINEQDAVKHALTRKLDAPKVKVIPNV